MKQEDLIDLMKSATNTLNTINDSLTQQFKSEKQEIQDRVISRASTKVLQDELNKRKETKCKN